VVHVQKHRESYSIVEFLSVESGHIDGEPLELEAEDLGQLLELVALEGVVLGETAGALIFVISFQFFRLQIVENRFFDRVIRDPLERILNRQIDVIKLSRRPPFIATAQTLDVADHAPFVDIANNPIHVIDLIRLLNGIEEYPHELLDVLLLRHLLVTPLKRLN
jgi:hypothetical protein